MARLVCSNCRYVLHAAALSDEETASEITDNEGTLVCPNCGETDTFFSLEGEAQSAMDIGDPEEVEALHTPYWHREGERIIVRIGMWDDTHPMDDSHHVDSVGIYDANGEEIEAVSRRDIDPESEIVFENIDPEEPVEVRLVCNLHGTWRGVQEDER